MALKPGFDLAQACRPGQLSEQQRQQLRSAIHMAHTMVAAMVLNNPVELIPGNMFRQLLKNTIVMLHGVDLHSRLKRAKTSETE